MPVFLQLTSENLISMNLLTEIDTIDIIKFLFADEKGFSVSKATWWCERNVGKTGNGSWSGFKDH